MTERDNREFEKLQAVYGFMTKTGYTETQRNNLIKGIYPGVSIRTIQRLKKAVKIYFGNPVFDKKLERKFEIDREEKWLSFLMDELALTKRKKVIEKLEVLGKLIEKSHERLHKLKDLYSPDNLEDGPTDLPEVILPTSNETYLFNNQTIDIEDAEIVEDEG